MAGRWCLKLVAPRRSAEARRFTRGQQRRAGSPLRYLLATIQCAVSETLDRDPVTLHG